MEEYFVTRVGFCMKCRKADRPKTGDEFIAFGSTSKQFLEKEAQHNGLAGLTPHTYKIFTKDGKIWVQSACAMNHCGVGYYEDEKGVKHWAMYEKSWSKPREISKADLRALIDFKDTGYQI